MKIITSTPFLVAGIPGRMEYPRHSLTLIVKGTFAFDPEGKTVPAKDAASPCGDEFYPDDERRESVRYESDFAWFKPKADLLLVGKCHAPDGKPIRTCDVTFQSGDRIRRLTVSGERRWKRNAFGLWRMTEPEPFTEMALRYENSFGGEGYEYNPVGKGFNAEQDRDGETVRRLPNIEDPNALIDSPRRRPMPAGYSPFGRMWRERRSRTGTYKGNYRKERWPWLPEDFDWRHFNAAPPEMQVEGYLRGDEKLYFENLHPRHSQFHSRLPGIRVRCFLSKSDDSGGTEEKFEEVAMNLDTLWVDMEAGMLALVWRGWAAVLSEDYEEVQDLFIMAEPLDQPPADSEECRLRFLRERAKQEKSWDMEPEDSEEPKESVAPAVRPEELPGPVTQPPATPDADPAYLQAQADAIFVQLGVDPERLPPEVREKQSRLLRKLTETDPAKIAEMERMEFDSQMRAEFAKLGLDPDRLPPASARAKAEQFRFMKELGIKPADIAADPEYGRILDLIGAVSTRMGMDPEHLGPLIEQAKKRVERFGVQFGEDKEQETQRAEEAETPPPTRETVRERSERSESFAGEDLQGLDLSGLDLSNLDFSKSNLSGADLAGTVLKFSILKGADLSGARLTEADITGADCSGADLTNAGMKKSILKDSDFTGSLLIGADLTGAVLTDALFEKARMSGAALDEVEAQDANFSEADLTESRFRKSACAGADFSKAVLDNADFRGADLSRASMDGAVGRKINMAETTLTELRASDGCDFAGGIFWNAAGPGSIWEKAGLAGSDFRGARMEGAVFTGSCLKQADLSYADMKLGRFNKADLQGAQLVRMNLFQGSLERADLTGADLSGSNMYGVEFLDAVTVGMRVEGTNLKMSKLQDLTV